MSVVVINRGVPGSGKSTFTDILSKTVGQYGKSISIHSTDDKFMVTGQYYFNPEKISSYHRQNQREFHESLSNGTDFVVVNNTNTSYKEYKQYLKSAEEFNAIVTSVVFIPDSLDAHASRNTHNVPIEVIEKMIVRLKDNVHTRGCDDMYQFTVYPDMFSDQYMREISEKIINVL